SQPRRRIRNRKKCAACSSSSWPSGRRRGACVSWPNSPVTTLNSLFTAPFIKRCSKSDPNLGQCMIESTVDAVGKLAAGSKDLGIVPLEPFFIEKVDLGNATSGAVNLHQIYRNMTIFGMTNATLKDSEANFTGDSCYWNYNTSTAMVRMESNYTMTGQLLVFPINGNGRCTNLLYDIEGSNRIKCERYQKNNRTHLRVTEFDIKITPKRVVFDYENIFNGSEQLSTEVVKTLNENSAEVYAEVGPAFDRMMATIWTQIINQVFAKHQISDPNLNKCLESAVIEAAHKFSGGNKDLGIVPLEPLYIEKIDLGNTSSDNCYWNYKTLTPKVVMEADYTMNGQLLLFPINGHGKCKNVLYDVQGEFKAKCEKYMKKNKRHVRVSDFDFKVKPKSVVFDFENIVDGNEQLSKQVVKTLNENALDVYADVGSAFDEVMGTIWKQTINQVFSRVPEEELFLP
ncbi:takeout, partial [Asbolus verrucosus]